MGSNLKFFGSFEKNEYHGVLGASREHELQIAFWLAMGLSKYPEYGLLLKNDKEFTWKLFRNLG